MLGNELDNGTDFGAAKTGVVSEAFPAVTPDKLTSLEIAKRMPKN